MARPTSVLAVILIALAASPLGAQTSATPPNAGSRPGMTAPGANTPGTPGQGEGSNMTAPATGCQGDIARADQQLRTIKDPYKKRRAMYEIDRAKQMLANHDERGCRTQMRTAERTMR